MTVMRDWPPEDFDPNNPAFTRAENMIFFDMFDSDEEAYDGADSDPDEMHPQQYAVYRHED